MLLFVGQANTYIGAMSDKCGVMRITDAEAKKLLKKYGLESVPAWYYKYSYLDFVEACMEEEEAYNSDNDDPSHCELPSYWYQWEYWFPRRVPYSYWFTQATQAREDGYG